MNVPHFFQSSESHCGPACLRMILEAFGRTHAEADIALCCAATPVGCTPDDLADGARALGVSAQTTWVPDEQGAIAALSNQTPFVAMIDLAALPGGAALFTWHQPVSGAEVIYHDPGDGPDRWAKLDDFVTAWATAGYRGVRLWIP